jgi:hypothetical protein
MGTRLVEEHERKEQVREELQGTAMAEREKEQMCDASKGMNEDDTVNL